MAKRIKWLPLAKQKFDEIEYEKILTRRGDYNPNEIPCLPTGRHVTFDKQIIDT